MSQRATFRATKTVHRGCGQELDRDGHCECSRARSAVTKAATGSAPPDPYAAGIAAMRARRGLAPLPDPRPAGSVDVPRFPLAGRPAADPYKAGIAAHRRRRGIEAPQGLPADYRPDVPPDPYAKAIAARRRALGLEVA